MTAAIARVRVERENVNDDSVVVLRVLVENGCAVQAGDPVMEIETSKTTMEITAPEPGSLSLAVAADDEVPIGGLLFEILSTEPNAATRENTAGVSFVSLEPVATTGASAAPPLFSRAAEARAAELGLSAARFVGQKWVTLQDVEHAAGTVARPGPSPARAPAKPEEQRRGPLLAEATSRYSLQRVPKRKRIEIERLTTYGNPFPQSTVGLSFDLPGARVVTPPFLFRDSISDLLTYEMSKLLRQYRELNGFYINERECGYYDSVNVGITFDSGNNLKVLAIENADALGLADLQRRFEQLLLLYESGETLPVSVLQSATVTLSDLSRTSADYMLPLINGRQSLILGVTRNGRRGYSLFATFDHRLAEGFRTLRFLEELRDRVHSYYYDETGAPAISCHACDRSIRQELELGGRGFLNIKLASGQDVPICRNCYEGW